MIIGIDGNEANVKQKVGVSNYTWQLLNYFSKIASEKLRFIVYLKNPPNPDLPSSSCFFKYQVIPGKYFWSRFFLPLFLCLNQKPDIFFSPAHYLPFFISLPMVVTIHDLSFFYYPNQFRKIDLYKLKNWTEYSVKKAKKIIAVSKTTKEDLIRFYKIPKEKIVVIYNGYEKPKKSKSWKKVLPKYGLKRKKFILHVGTLQPRKNLEVLVDGFLYFVKENPQYQLVLAGKKGWLYKNLIKKIENLPLSIRNKIILTDFLSDEELVTLYQNAFVLVISSLYEGFGLPLLEAMSFNLPVISSAAPSLLEIGADACLYFNPYSSFELKEKLTKLVKDKKLTQELIQKGKKRVKFFSWQRCAKQTLKVLTSLKKNDYSIQR